VSPLLRGTAICPVFANLVGFVVAFLLSEKRIVPTWFRAPSFPSLLW
jgi:hypothetical protein